MTIPFIKYSKIWLFLSAAVAVVSIVFLLMWGLKPGIDFTGGSLLEVTFEKNRPEHTLVQKTLEDLGQKNAVIQKYGDKSLIMRVGFLTEDQHQLVLRELRTKYATDGNTLRED